MDLVTHQRKLLELIKGRYEATEPEDPYIHAVAQSKNFSVLQEIIALWQVYVLQHGCPLTTAALTRCGLLMEEAAAFTRRPDSTQFRDNQSDVFLERMTTHAHELIHAVAQFELSLHRMHDSGSEPVVIAWEREPVATLNALIHDLPLPEPIGANAYWLRVWSGLPNGFEIIAPPMQ